MKRHMDMKVDKVIVHCSYTYPDMDIGVDTIRDWHVNGNGWKDIGYHYIIRRDGSVEQGRDENTPGAHVAGHNNDSLGICLIGGKGRAGKQGNNFTAAQWATLEKLVTNLCRVHKCPVMGHNDYDGSKTCPTFDVRAWAESLDI